jgi:hypothetical protein
MMGELVVVLIGGGPFAEDLQVANHEPEDASFRL